MSDARADGNGANLGLEEKLWAAAGKMHRCKAMIGMQEQHRRLHSIWDAILPLLLSGELDVSKVKARFSGEVTNAETDVVTPCVCA